MKTKLLGTFLCLFIAISMAYPQSTGEDFKTFLNKFTTSASFQYERIKFPLSNSILLINDDDQEQEFPFTREKWPLLDKESFREGRFTQEDDGIYVTGFVLNDPERKEFEAGYEESEIDLRIVFELIDGKWFVTDCYNAWYSFDLPVDLLDETIKEVQEYNKEFEKLYP